MWEPPSSIPTVAEIVRYASIYVSGLDDQKIRLATAIRRHMVAALHDRPYRQANVLVVGPTGGGKTFLIRRLLEAFGCINTEINAAAYSEVGYAGLDLTSCPIGFYSPPWLEGGGKRNQLTPLAERWGVIVIDEWDKLRFRKDPSGRDTGRTLQSELLRIAEGDVVYARARDNEMGTAFDTRYVLFIGLGAFEGLSRLVDPTGGIAHAYVRAEPKHIQAYGFMEELVGRFSTIVCLPPLQEAHMYRILVEHIWPRWVQMASDEGISLRWDDQALRLAANQACQTGVGARGLEPQVEQALWKAWGTVKPGQEIYFGPEHLVTGAAVLDTVGAS